ncbi:MAG: type II toxin-antitoxin system RelE/ParE family toxin [Planctomycetes bacterium]|nr:type II toxin-antitoxin system RelE/ParE family toxin [Planctomycetota bacterium]MBL7153580.1 type II toxin-antitoxin system RelE/ParE family toxin [Phycisphaerae bacterium]
MPETGIVIYKDANESVPLIEWLDKQSPKVQDKCIALIELLASRGHELRRPYAEYLDGGVYELRPTVKHVQYRVLYCFVARNVVLLTHGLVKTRKIPTRQIDKAIEYREKFVDNPQRHSYVMKD